MGPLHNKQALLFILLIVCQATIWYTPDFHKWKAIFPPVEKEFSTSGNLLPFNECPFETSNDMTGNSTCAPPTIALLPVYAPCVPRCAV